MKKFFEEFKKFITRGNVIDLSVGVIVGGAFSAIVNALTTNILQPIINWVIALIFGGDSKAPVYTVLRGVYLEDGVLDTANSIFIDWGAFISAIINFIIIAFVLFIIIRAVNRISESNEKFKDKIKKSSVTKEERKEMKTLGLNPRKIEDIKAYKAKKEQEALLKAEAEAKEKEALEKEEKSHSTEGLLEQIRSLLEDNLKKIKGKVDGKN